MLLSVMWTGECLASSFEGAGMGYNVGAVASYIAAGQSNMGISSDQSRVSLASSPTSFTSRIWRWTLQTGIMDDSFLHFGTTDASPYPSFANKMQELTGRPVRVFYAPSGGTCLATDEDSVGCADYAGSEPRGPQWDPDVTGRRYDQMLTKFKTIGFGPSLKAVLWFQGECEMAAACSTLPSNGVDKESDYQAALEHLADVTFQKFGVPIVAVAPSDYSGLPGGTCGGSGPGASRQAIHDAVLAAIAASSKIYAGPDVDGVTLKGDCTHIWDVKTFGEDLATAVYNAGLY